MTDHVDQADELLFVRYEFSMARRNGFAEESQGAGALVQHCAEAHAGGVALDDEPRNEVW